jgi:hypothetical protein
MDTNSARAAGKFSDILRETLSCKFQALNRRQIGKYRFRKIFVCAARLD